MMNTLNIVNILFKELNNDVTITGAINGGVYKKRPVNSNKEDIVIGALTLSFEQIQEGVINVNIHVPNVSVKVNGMQDTSQPDYSKLEALTTLVTSKLDEQYFSGGDDLYWFYVQQQALFEGEGNEHYSNIRIKFNSKK